MSTEQIMKLLDWNSSIEDQQIGIEFARKVSDLSCFLQHPSYSKSTWDNCAIVLSNRSDSELAPYLSQLLEWLQDLNWTGSITILKRLQSFSADIL